MTLSARADARLLLSRIDSGELIRGARWSGFFAVCRVCELPRGRIKKIEMMIRSVVTADAAKSS